MVEKAPINILMADLDLRITYANPASISTLQQLESFLPIKVSQLMGSNIDIFHKNPAHQRKLLSDPRNLPLRATINIGPEKADLLVTAVTNDKGDYIGPMVTWEVITEKLKLQEAQARLKSMVENAPINIIMADLDFKITYSNPASQRTLQGLEHLLPCKASELVGKSIDIFHKNPSHQRKLLSNPRNLPHRAKIALGNETLDLLATAIMDDKGTYLGPMVTWSVITDRIRIFKTLSETSTTLASSSTELSSSSQQMAAAAEQTISQSEAVAAATEQADRNAQVVASSVTEMASAVGEISRNMQKTREITADAVRTAESTNQIIGKLGDSSQKIGKVVKLITSIAQQTNLLALNATIEAARAGEAGKGFAVVANEVKELAKQTAKATDEIGAQIDAIQADTKTSVQAIADITKIINQIATISATVAAATEEQSSTTNDISRNVSEVAQGTKDIGRNILSVTEAARSSGTVASGVRESAENLSKLATTLTDLVKQFEV